MKNILVTGAAGFIGYHVSERLLRDGFSVVGIDNMNDYYDVGLKRSRLDRLSDLKGFRFYECDISDEKSVFDIFDAEGIDGVVHLAAQAGVRYSLQNPRAYIDSNIVGFLNILEASRKFSIKHLVYASSSSVYGLNQKMPFSVGDSVDHPASLYAATKKSNELMAHSYSHLFDLPTTGLRFFTVYGPWGRPDMSPFLFLKSILEGKRIDVFNFGRHKRDFTYIDDIVSGVVSTLTIPATRDTEWQSLLPRPGSSSAPWRIYNIGNNKPIELLDFIGVISDVTGIKPAMNLLPMQPGDVEATWADIDPMVALVGYEPKTDIRVGMENFISWFRGYYKV